MKKIVTIFASLFIIAIAAQNVNAQEVSPNPTASSEASASANIIKVISIDNTGDLLFGNIIASSAGGTLTIPADGDPYYDGIAAPTGNEGTRQAATFTVEGENMATYSLTLPTSVTLSSGAETMTLTEFSDNAKKVLEGGEEVFNVGATLTVNPNQQAGEYTGTFEVTVAYN